MQLKHEWNQNSPLRKCMDMSVCICLRVWPPAATTAPRCIASKYVFMTNWKGLRWPKPSRMFLGPLNRCMEMCNRQCSVLEGCTHKHKDTHANTHAPLGGQACYGNDECIFLVVCWKLLSREPPIYRKTVTDRMLDRRAEQMPKRMPKRMPERMSDRRPGKMPEKVWDR